MAKIDEKALNKGELKKLGALRKSLGDEIANEAFAKWFANKATIAVVKDDPVALQIQKALDPFLNDPKFKLGAYGYTVRKAKGRGVVAGFVAYKNEKPKK